MRSIEPAIAPRWADMAGELAGVGYWWMDAATQVIRWSPNMFKIYGIPPEQVPSLDYAMQFLHPDDRELADATLEDNLLGVSTPNAVRIVRPSGEVRYIEGRNACEVGPNGEVVAIYGTVHDVTDRRVIELALAESEARYRLLAEAASDVILRVGSNQVIEYVSPSIRRFGWSPDDMVGKTPANFIHADDVDRVLNSVAAKARHAAPQPGVDHSYRMLKADNSYVWVEANSSLVRKEDGSILAYVCQLRDVTERRQASQALAESEARYRVIADNVSEVISRTGVDGTILYLSPAIVAMTGYTSEELVGTSMVRQIHLEDRGRVIEEYRQLIVAPAQEHPSQVYRVQHKDGHWISIEASPTVICDSRGQPTEFLSVTRDVSARVKLEEDLRAAADAAVSAAATKSDFLANMSHEIRTPLTAILGFTGLMAQSTHLDATARGHLDRISSASDALLSIVNDVLDFSRLEASQCEIRQEPAAPVDLVKDVLAMFEPQTDTKGLRVAFKTAGEVPAGVLIDKARVRQILFNLVGNAVKFTEHGVITVTAGYDPDAQQLLVDVTDSGPGLREADQTKLFQRFSQVDASSTRRHGGTGLGLAICKGLVEAMGGAINVASLPGQGATFSFRIDAKPCNLVPAPGANEAALTLEGVRVLVADDNSGNRDLVRAILIAVGAEVTEAGDGSSAVSEAVAMPFDVILMDIRMPGQDGPAALRQIRQLAGPNRFTPVIAFSADVEFDAFDRDAFDGVVRKPIAPRALIAGLRHCLSDAWIASGEANATL
jgi:PAS domain S-box-containing protein